MTDKILLIQLPCLIFAMLTLGFMLDHFIFGNRKLKPRTKAAAFTACASIVVGVWWWYRRIAWGIEGNVNEVSGTKCEQIAQT